MPSVAPDAPLFWAILKCLNQMYICDYYHCVSVILVSR